MTASINHAPAITSETDPVSQTVIVNPVALAQGINTNSLGLSTETFDGLLSFSSGNFHSAALDATFSSSGNVGVINGTIPGVAVALFLGPLPGSVDTTNYLSISSVAPRPSRLVFRDFAVLVLILNTAAATEPSR